MEWGEVVAGFGDPGNHPPVIPRREFRALYAKMAEDVQAVIAEL